MTATWRVIAQNEVDRLSQEVERLGLDREAPGVKVIDDDIARAQTAVRARGSVRSWWTGSHIETTWAALHRAQGYLLNQFSSDELRATIPEVESAVRTYLRGDNKPRAKRYIDRLKKMETAERAPDGAALRVMLASAHQASDIAHGKVRALRNILLLGAAALTLALGGLTVWQAEHRGLLPVCAAPVTPAADADPDAPIDPDAPDQTKDPSKENERLCPAAGPGEQPGWADVLIIQAMGAFGAIFASVATLSRQRGLRGPYGLPQVQALVKIPAGAATALTGVLVMQNEVLDVLDPQTGGKLLAFALLFGYGQQAFTKKLDEQVRSTMGAAQSRNDPAATNEAAATEN